MKQERLKNNKRGWDTAKNKVVLYSWWDNSGRVWRADGKLIGNYLTGTFLLKEPS